MAISKASSTIVSSQSNAAGATTSGTVDLTAAYGATVTSKITNGATGPTVACTVNLYTSHDGSAWKLRRKYTASTTANAVLEMPQEDLPASVMHCKVEFTGNTGQTVTVEAFAQRLTGI